jgi:energy-coupling factor transporter ATP-binding protein EcfA2
VITSVRIENLRGIREGLLDGLAPISILVGPNNCGKSTCLEAIAIAGLGGKADEAARILMRRGGPALDALAHVVRDGAKYSVVELPGTAAADGGDWMIRLSLDGPVLAQRLPSSSGLSGDQTRMWLRRVKRLPDGTYAESAVFGAFLDIHGAAFMPDTPHGFPSFPVQLVDVEAVRAPGALEDAHSRIDRARRLPEVVRALQKSMPGLEDLRILKNGPDFILHTFRKGGEPPVPAYLAGDGFKRFLELAAAVLDTKSGVVLLEEPEAYQHPRYLSELATLLHLAAKNGAQIILSTHSIELVDLLLHAPEADGLTYPTVHRLRLHAGALKQTAIQRETAVSARDDLMEDLRS